MFEEVDDAAQQLITALQQEAAVFDDGEAQVKRIGGLLEHLDQTQAQLAGIRMELVNQAKTSSVDKVIDQIRMSARTTTQRASADLRLASDLVDRFPLIHAKVCDGTVSLAQAEGMIQGLNTLPARLSQAEWEEAQAFLLAKVSTLGPKELRIAASRLLEKLDPVTAEEEEAKRIEREERRARANRILRIRNDHHGAMVITGKLPLAEGSLFKAQIDALMPSRASYVNDDIRPTMEARRADALVAMSQMFASAGTLPDQGMDRPHIHVTMPLKALVEGLGRVELLGQADAAQLSAADARRLACDANIIPMVLGGASQPLDVGRKRRLVTKSLRQVLIQRDRGCAFPHCDAIPAVCEAHHIQPWWAGGETALENLVLLCPHHHRAVEPDVNQSPEHQWEVHIDPVSGRPVFSPPRHIDLARTPRLHRRHLIDVLNSETKAELPDKAELCPPEPEIPPERRIGDFILPEPKDDPWHPDYIPPPRRVPQPE